MGRESPSVRFRIAHHILDTQLPQLAYKLSRRIGCKRDLTASIGIASDIAGGERVRVVVWRLDQPAGIGVESLALEGELYAPE